MAATDVAKRINQKLQTRNAILRLQNGSFRVLNREKLNQKIIARIRHDRESLLDARRDVAEAELRRIAADVLEDECREGKTTNLVSIQNDFNLEQELLLEEELEREAVQQYEEWLQSEIDNILSNEESSEEMPLVCPVCCRQCFLFDHASIECSECRVRFPLSKTIGTLRHDINAHLAEHNAGCRQHPQFAHVPDSGGRNNLLMLCHFCSYLNVLL